MKEVTASNLLLDKTTTGAGSSSGPAPSGRKSFQVIVNGTGVVSATVDIEVSNNNSNFFAMTTVAVTGTTTANDGFATDAPWRYYRANVTAIAGTGAKVSVLVGEVQ